MLKRFFAVLALCAAVAIPAQAHSVLELQLDEIIDTAAVAFEGTVIETHSEKDAASGQIVTYTTFAVTDVLKGNVGAKHTIKQLGGQVGDLNFKVTLQQKYVPGQSVVVFLYGKSNLGFSAPVGIAQGNFPIVQDADGVNVSNGREFTRITERMTAAGEIAAKAKGKRADPKKMGLDEFKLLVRNHVRGAQ